MEEFIRLKPLCLIVISGLNIEDLSNMNHLKGLVQDYPFLTLNSNYSKIDDFWKSYIELGNGNYLKDIKDKNNINLSQVISEAGLKQLHLADLESYAYITYFLNNKIRNKNNEEDWISTNNTGLDFNPENPSINNKVTKKLIKEINKQYYDFMVVNYYDLILKPFRNNVLSNLDKNINEIIDIILSFNGGVLITSNSSLKEDNSQVPLFLISKIWKNKSFIDYDFKKGLDQQNVNGNIVQLAPSVLKILGLSKPRTMKTKSLI